MRSSRREKRLLPARRFGCSRLFGVCRLFAFASDPLDRTRRSAAMWNRSFQGVGKRAIAEGDSYRWIVLGVAVAAQSLTAVVSQGTYTLIPFWKAEYSLSQASAALPGLFLNGGQTVSMLFLGRAIDRYGERSVVGAGVAAMSLAAFGAAMLASSYLVLLLFLALVGVFYASVQPGGTRAIIRWFPSRQHGVAIGIRQAAFPLGTALAAATLPLMAHRYGWTTAMRAASACGLAGGVFFAAFHRDGSAGWRRAGLQARSTLIGNLKVVMKNAALRPVLVAGIVLAGFQFTFAAHAVTFSSIRLKTDIVTASLAFAVAQGVGIVARIGLPWASDCFWPGQRMRSLSRTICLAGASAFALLLLPIHSSPGLTWIVFAGVGLFGIGWYPLWMAEIAELAPRNALAWTISFAMTLNLLSMSLAPLLFGVIIDWLGYSTAWAVLTAILILAAFNLRRGTLRRRFCRTEPATITASPASP